MTVLPFYHFPENMPLEEKISNDLKKALKARDQLRVSCLRMLKTEIKNQQVEKREKLKDEEIETAVSLLIKKGQQAAEEFQKGGREDLATKEKKEIEIFYEYLPKQLDSFEIEKILQEIISDRSAGNAKDLGKVMKVAMARMAGKAQGKAVSEIARKMLSQPD